MKNHLGLIAKVICTLIYQAASEKSGFEYHFLWQINSSCSTKGKNKFPNQKHGDKKYLNLNIHIYTLMNKYT